MTYLFSYAFRPLFFLAVAYSIVSIGWWGLALRGYLPLPAAGGNPMFWHAHEMIFGFGAAAIGGFALTAVANWTKRPPVSGAPLIALCGFWLSARVLGVSDNSAMLLPMATADLAFNLLLLLLMAREVIAGKSQRNHKLLALLAVLAVANAAFYLGQWQSAAWTRTALWAGMWAIVLTVNLIGGRVIPAFTGNWLMLQAKRSQRTGATRPPPFGPIDQFASVATTVFALLFLWDHTGVLTALVGFVAAGSQLLRWSRWQFYRTLGDPLVWVLHLGFVWIPIGLALLACSALELLPLSAGIHALTTGGIATMVLAMASRAALGHTNRPLANHPLTTAAYIGVTATTALRIAASLSDTPATWLLLASFAWVASMGLFALRYTPILLGPPAGENT
jgi:uncharacterized protein involved in response to NO